MGNDHENENVEILVTEFESLRSEIQWLVANLPDSFKQLSSPQRSFA